GYTVQIAAVTRKEDADALVAALRKKQYPVFVATSASDKFLRVQVGPFSDPKEAETMRQRLIGDGYKPILKK
ncbi:MAG: SPOR domain-containing protein, partial [Terriglobales bacterium]